MSSTQDSPEKCDSDTECLQKELLDYTDLFTRDDDSDYEDPDSEVSEDSDDSDDSDDLDDEFEKDLDLLDQDEQPDLQLHDPALLELKEIFGNTIFCNTSEENDVILNCNDTELQALLIENRLRARQLTELHNKLVQVLYDSIQELNSCGGDHLSPYIPKTDIWKLGIPYFKDKQFFSCPDNVDVARKQNNKEYSLISFKEGRRWTAEEQNLLKTTVEHVYYQQYYDQLDYQIKIRTIEHKNSKKDDLCPLLDDLNNELEKMKSDVVKYKTPPYYLETDLDWHKIADAFKGNRTPNECKALWNIYLHPHVNKSLWTPEEDNKIKILAKKHNFQNWDLIAKELNTNRSGYLVFLNYSSNICSKFRSDRFTQSEDQRLLDAVEECRIGKFIPWQKIAFAFKDRSKHQLYHRYNYYLVNNQTKGAFTEAEDVLLLHLVKRFGKDYAKCSSYFPNRSAVQLRNRHAIYLDSCVLRGNFTQSDDELILEHVKTHGSKNWGIVARRLKRTRAHVRQRYVNLQKWLDQPDTTLESIPRRQLTTGVRRYLDRFGRSHEVAKMLDECKDVPNLHLAEEYLKSYEPDGADIRLMKTKKSNSSYDNQIIEFFKGTCKVQRDYRSYDPALILESAERVIKLMHLLSADPNMILSADSELVSNRDHDVVNAIKKLDQSKFQPNKSLHVSYILPPTLNAILGLRWLLVKYQLYKESPTCNINNNLLKNLQTDPERRLFFTRFCTLFKWASVISQFFPEQLNVDESKKLAETETQKPKAKAGRPKKTSYPKVANMVTARKRRNETSMVNASFVPFTLPKKSRQTPNPGTYPLTYSALKTIRTEGHKEGVCEENILDEVLSESEDDSEIDEPIYLPSRKRKRNVETFQLPTLCAENESTEDTSAPTHFRILNNVPVVDTDIIKKLGLSNKNIIFLPKENIAEEDVVENIPVFKVTKKRLETVTVSETSTTDIPSNN